MPHGGRTTPTSTSPASTPWGDAMRGRITALLLAAALAAGLSGCSAETEEAEQYPTFPYTHYSSGGTQETYQAVILFEQSNSTFTSYQVAFSSCTCRDAIVNYYSVAYVELLNNKDDPEEAAVRAITFGENRGLWGDSNPNYYRSEYTQEYMDENFVQALVRAEKADFDAWGGYGTQVQGVDVDAVAGATVSTSNITSMLQGLFAYHTEHYY